MTTYLLDSHTLIWWWLDRPMLSPAARSLIGSNARDLRVSAVTAFEIGQKVRIGKLPELAEPLADYDANLRLEGISQLHLTGEQMLLAGTMKSEHRDPFDRMIAAQALTGELTIVSGDGAFTAFGCKTLW